MMFYADDLVVCEHSRAYVEMQLDKCRDICVPGTKSKQRKTEYMPCPEKDQTIYLQEKEVKKMKMFK